MQYQKGQRVVLVYTDDPQTQLRPGDTGTVLRHDRASDTVHIAWDSGSHLSMCLDAGDQIRVLRDEASEHAPTLEQAIPDCLVQFADQLGYQLDPDLNHWLEACIEEPATVVGALTAGLRHAAHVYVYSLASSSYEFLRMRALETAPADIELYAPRLAALDRHLNELAIEVSATGRAYRLALEALHHQRTGLV